MVGKIEPNMLRRMQKREEQEEEQQEQEENDSCDHSECDPEWKFCPKCGEELD